MLNALRWVFLASAVISILGGTLLYRSFAGPWAKRWWALFDRPGVSIPAVLRNDYILRTWSVVSGAIMLVLWWYLGTEAGKAAFENLMRQARGAA
jgi:hypothetical protein